ncbi:hypothetical protein K438DRAFT_1857806 [Mycena galopus ATCC 62051]|nr:hypothetical protein K438DRAFT_1857806 [Mycena galopus ATCC 62051]
METFPPFFAVSPPNQNRWLWPGKPEAIKAMPWSRAPEAFKRANASWRRMLVTQPPARTMVIISTSHGRRGDSVRRGVLNDPALRMGDLYDVGLMYMNGVASSARILWHHDVHSEDDLVLDTMSTVQCVVGPPPLGQEFYSEGARFLELKARIKWDANV